MANTATRLLTLLMLLQRQPNQQAAALATALGVSVRTLHRYLTMLEEMGIPIYSERGPYGGFSLVRGYKLPPLVFTPEEAVALYLGIRLVRELWGALYATAAAGALAKLDNVLPDEQRQEVAWAQRALVATGMHRTPPESVATHLAPLRQAIHDQHQVTLSYQGRTQPETTTRTVDPYALVHRWGWWYLVGYCHVRQAVRSFRLDRITQLQTLAQPFVQPAAFDINTYLATELTAQPQQRVRLRFTSDAAQVAKDSRYLWETISEEADGSLVVTLVTPDLQWAASTVLAYAGLATVLEPVALRTLVRERALLLVQQHSSLESEKEL